MQTPFLYVLVKWLHVLAAITALGSNITFGLWIARASSAPAVLPFTLRTIKLIDDRMANPAYGLLFITGAAMMWIAKYPMRTPWLLSALVLYAVMFLLGLFGYTPTLKRQIAALDKGGPASPEYLALARRGRLLGMILAVVVLTIVFLMVVKPALWSAAV